MPVMNYRKGTEKEKSWIIEQLCTGKCKCSPRGKSIRP